VGPTQKQIKKMIRNGDIKYHYLTLKAKKKISYKSIIQFFSAGKKERQRKKILK